LNTNNLIINKKMKKLFFLLILCFSSINIYAQKDTRYVFRHNIVTPADMGPLVVMVPDSISSGHGTAEQNWRAWHNGEKVFLRYDTDISYRWFTRTTERQEKFLSFNKNIGKCLISPGVKFSKKTFAWEILIEIFLIFIISFVFGALWEAYRDREELEIPIILIIVSAVAISFTMFFFLPICFEIEILPTQPLFFSPVGIIPGVILGYCLDNMPSKPDWRQTDLPTMTPYLKKMNDRFWDDHCW